MRKKDGLVFFRALWWAQHQIDRFDRGCVGAGGSVHEPGHRRGRRRLRCLAVAVAVAASTHSAARTTVAASIHSAVHTSVATVAASTTVATASTVAARTRNPSVVTHSVVTHSAASRSATVTASTHSAARNTVVPAASTVSASTVSARTNRPSAYATGSRAGAVTLSPPWEWVVGRARPQTGACCAGRCARPPCRVP